MAVETTTGSTETPDGGGHRGGSGKVGASVSSRAAFFADWSWVFAVGHSRGGSGRNRGWRSADPAVEGVRRSKRGSWPESDLRGRAEKKRRVIPSGVPRGRRRDGTPSRNPGGPIRRRTSPNHRGPSTSLRPSCRLRSARDDTRFGVPVDRVAWRPHAAAGELTALPESLESEPR